MNHASRLPRWQIYSAVFLGGFLGALFVAALTIDLATGLQAAGSGERPLKLGIAHVPSANAPDGRIYVEEGFEGELAQSLGDRLGTGVEIIPVAPDERRRALVEKRIDALIVRAASDDDLRQSAILMPTGYESGLSPVARSDRPLQRWQDLAGKPVCVSEANEDGQRLIRVVGGIVRVLRAPAQALMLVRTGECAAAVHDRVLLDLLFKKMAWQKFSATLPPREPTALVVAVAKDREGLARDISKALASIGSINEWQKRREKWASLVAFEVYRDQVAGDCH